MELGLHEDGISNHCDWNSTDNKIKGAVKLPTYTCGDAQVQMASFAGYKLVGVNYKD